MEFSAVAILDWAPHVGNVKVKDGVELRKDECLAMSLVLDGLLQLAKSAAFWIEKLVIGDYATQSLQHITGPSEAGIGLSQFNRTLHNAEKGSTSELKLLLMEMSELRAELPAPQVSALYRFLCRDQVSPVRSLNSNKICD